MLPLVALSEQRLAQRRGHRHLADRPLRRLADTAEVVVLDEDRPLAEIDVAPLEGRDLRVAQAHVEGQPTDQRVVGAELRRGAEELGEPRVGVDLLGSLARLSELLHRRRGVDAAHPLGEAEELGELRQDEVDRARAQAVGELRPEHRQSTPETSAAGTSTSA